RAAALRCLSLSVPAERGGFGGDTVDEAVVFEEAGRALYPGPLFASVALAQPGLLAAADAAPRGAARRGACRRPLAPAGAARAGRPPRPRRGRAGRLRGQARRGRLDPDRDQDA